MKIDLAWCSRFLGILVLSGGMVLAEEAPSLPDAPQPQQTSAVPDGGKQTKRILGIMPNFRSVSVDQKMPPMSSKDKLVLMYHDSFDYSSFVFTGVMSGLAMSQNSYPEFHQGAAGYGRYYWHNLADSVDGNLMGEAIVPTLARQDPRFYTLGRGNVGKRAAYAMSRLVVAKADSGHMTFNYGEVIGNGAASGVSNLYYPRPYRTWTKTGQRWLINCSTDGLSNLVKEFWPDVNHKIFHAMK